jgi:hypothetical protein
VHPIREPEGPTGGVPEGTGLGARLLAVTGADRF